MTKMSSKSSRRAFFLQGGAAIGASVAAGATAVASGKPPTTDQSDVLREQLALAADREAIRQVHLNHLFRVENRTVEALAGGATILRVRPNHLQQSDAVTFSEDRQYAAAIYHVDVQLGTPLQGNFTVAQMARLQGQMTDHRWECGRLEAKYAKQRGEWMIENFSYLAS